MRPLTIPGSWGDRMSGINLSRRGLMRATAAPGLSALDGCSIPPPPPPPVAAARAIDVHCHLFNARDIPVEPFIREVVLREYPLADVLAEPVVILAQSVLELGAMSATREAGLLRGMPGVLAFDESPELPDIPDEE